MDKKIAVICASPPGINPGMDSVDYAFWNLIKKNGINEFIQFWNLYPANRRFLDKQKKVAIPYAIIPQNKEFFESQQGVLYWGDFLHMRQYHQAVSRRLVNSGAYSIENAENRTRNIFLQADQKFEVLRRTITFGSTLVFNNLMDETYSPYSSALERFLKNCKASWFRDVYSAFKVSHLLSDFKFNHLGIDCATLIDPSQIQALQETNVSNDEVGIFIGRTSNNVETMVSFSNEVAKALSCKLVWLKWGDSNAFPDLNNISKLDPIFSIDAYSEEPVEQVEIALSNLLKYRAIITDTYHICVNAWNLGIPTICLTSVDFTQIRNVNSGDFFARRDKREIFMSMYDALDFLVPIEDIKNIDWGKTRISHLVTLINSGDTIKSIQKRIRSHSKAIEEILMKELMELI